MKLGKILSVLGIVMLLGVFVISGTLYARIPLDKLAAKDERMEAVAQAERMMAADLVDGLAPIQEQLDANPDAVVPIPAEILDKIRGLSAEALKVAETICSDDKYKRAGAFKLAKAEAEKPPRKFEPGPGELGGRAPDARDKDWKNFQEAYKRGDADSYDIVKIARELTLDADLGAERLAIILENLEDSEKGLGIDRGAIDFVLAKAGIERPAVASATVAAASLSPTQRVAQAYSDSEVIPLTAKIVLGMNEGQMEELYNIIRTGEQTRMVVGIIGPSDRERAAIVAKFAEAGVSIDGFEEKTWAYTAANKNPEALEAINIIEGNFKDFEGPLSAFTLQTFNVNDRKRVRDV